MTYHVSAYVYPFLAPASHSLEALTYYVYALCFCTRQNARETIAWPMISGSRAALLNRIPIVKLAKIYVRPLP